MFEEKTLGTDACFLICPVPEIIIIQNHVVPMLGISFFFGGGQFGEPSKQIFGKKLEFCPNQLDPSPPRKLGFLKLKKENNVYFAF